MMRFLTSWFTPKKNVFAEQHKDRMIYDVRQIGEIVPLTSPGICDALVMEWFRRIWAGRTTWRHKNGRNADGEKQLTIRDEVDWSKKRERLERLQKSYDSYGADRRFGYTKLPAAEDPARQTDLATSSPYKLGDNYGDKIMAKLDEVRQGNRDEPHLFFALRLSLDGYGHMIGLHLMREGSESASSTATRIDGNMLHLFDPNVGEFRATNVYRAYILDDLLRMYGDRIKHFTLSRVHVWWGRNQAPVEDGYEVL